MTISLGIEKNCVSAVEKLDGGVDGGGRGVEEKTE
jgi:hypothetical protein